MSNFQLSYGKLYGAVFIAFRMEATAARSVTSPRNTKERLHLIYL